MANLKFADMHNLAIVLADPPVVHSDMLSMIHRLRECCIASALTVNPVIYQNIVREFWATARTQMDDDGNFTVAAKVQGRDIVIDESFVRNALLIDDQPNYPTEIGIEDVQRILRRMSYEGTYPPTLKKLLHPYWRFLAHVFVSCISGRRSGADEISQRTTGALVSLASGIHFNFSKFILEEFVINIRASTRDTFLQYPRFIQVFVEMQFPEVRKAGDTLDMKSLGPHTVGLIKQNRRGKVVFRGRYPLEKFGKFTELDETPVSYESSEPTSSEKTSTEGSTPANIVIDVTEDDEDSPTPRDQSASSHEHESNERQDEREMGTGDDGHDSFEDLDLTGFDNDDIAASLASSANVVSNEILDTIFQNVDAGVLP